MLYASKAIYHMGPLHERKVPGRDDTGWTFGGVLVKDLCCKAAVGCEIEKKPEHLLALRLSNPYLAIGWYTRKPCFNKTVPHNHDGFS